VSYSHFHGYKPTLKSWAILIFTVTSLHLSRQLFSCSRLQVYNQVVSGCHFHGYKSTLKSSAVVILTVTSLHLNRQLFSCSRLQAYTYVVSASYLVSARFIHVFLWYLLFNFELFTCCDNNTSTKTEHTYKFFIKSHLIFSNYSLCNVWSLSIKS